MTNSTPKKKTEILNLNEVLESEMKPKNYRRT